MPCNFCQSGGPFAGMLVKALFRWKKDRLRLYLFSLEIEKKTWVIVKNGAIVKIGVHFFSEPRNIERWVVEGAEDDITV